MELMGHSRNEDTNDLYSQIELSLLRDAIAKLESWADSHRKALPQIESPDVTPSTLPEAAIILQ